MRYPYVTRLNEFLAVYECSSTWNGETFDDRSRIMRKMGKTIETLHEAGLISTQDPKFMTPEDIHQFAIAEIKNGVNGLIKRETMLMKKICMFYGNNCVEIAKIRYPDIMWKKNRSMLPSYGTDFIQKLIEYSSKETDFLKLRGYAATILSVCGGLRAIEVQNAKVANYDPETGDLYLEVVKGMETYGKPRPTVIRPEGRAEIARYLKLREAHLREIHVESPYFFFSEYTGEMLSQNMSYRLRRDIEKEIGVKFDFRMCRRTYLQAAIDEDLSADTMSVIAGHNDRDTIDIYYARKRQKTAVETLHKRWDEEK